MPQEKSPRQEFATRLAALVQQFERHQPDYLRADYSEAQARLDFINPFFEALGWDIRNKAGLGSKEREVVVEQGETVGRPDYNFRLNGRTVFFAEAKAPHVPLDRTDVIMQAKSYAWNSPDVFISTVTDFEEFRLYDTTAKPDRKHPDVGLIFAYRYTDYLNPKTLDDLWLLSKESVTGGSIDRLLKMSSVKAHQRIPVDRAFLDDLTGWREKLAKAVYKARPDWAVADLNSAVQVFLDRLIFIRIAEDRGILPPRELEDIAGAWKLSGKRRPLVNDLNALFHEVNGLLNGEIFKPHLCEKVDWDQSADLVVDIINKLYPPESLYRFDVIGVELLGSIYERYLGKTIRVTATRAVVEDKPEVRKAGGVYYTPKYIVDYIVDQTVGKLIEGKTPAQIAKLKILDPACGSGSFLLGAYQKLLDYHTRYYTERAYRRDAQRTSPQARLIRDGEGGEFKLSLEQKAEILRNNIYGVDIDPQAVEITMMSLYIKLLEGERGLMINHAVLPPLRDNIKCGNSLIGHDIIHQPDLLAEGELSSEDLNRINPFDWESKSEGFGEIMEAGGFDAIIGNPPWGADLAMGEKQYLISKFANVHMRTPDTFNYFLANSYAIGSPNSVIGMIIPNNFLFQHEYAKARRFFVEKAWLTTAVNLGDGVFAVTVPSCIVIINHRKARAVSKQTQIADLRNVDRSALAAHLKDAELAIVETGDILSFPDCIVPMNKNVTGLMAHILRDAPILLGDVCDEVAAGIGTGGDKVFRIEDRLAKSLSVERDVLHPVLIGREMHAYYVPGRTGYSIIYSTKAISSRTHPKALEYLKPFQAQLSKKRETQKGLIPWWSLHWPRYPGLFEAPKIVMRQTANSLYAAVDDFGYYCLNSIIIVRPKNALLIKYYLGLLNSRLLRWLYRNLTQEQNRTFAEVKPVNLRKLPIRTINFSDPADKARHERMILLVERMLDLHKQTHEAKSAATRTRIEREIHVTDEQIDTLVYELYSLTGDEIKIVEGTA